MKLITKVTAVFVVAFGVLGLWYHHSKLSTQTVTNQTKTQRVTALKLVALGDSLTHGVGDTTNKGGFVYRIAKTIKAQQNVAVTTDNFGKTGDRSDQILARLNASKSQQAAVKSANVITLTVGGNDLMQTLQQNVAALLTNTLNKKMPSAEGAYQQRLQKLLTKIRQLNAHAPIFVFSIYNPFYVYFPTLTDLSKYTNEWNDVTKSLVAKTNAAYFVDINNQLSQGQYYHKSKTKLEQTTYLNLSSLSSGKLESLLANQKEKNDYLSSADHFHPNNKGYDYMTARLYSVMMKHTTEWLYREEY